MKPKQRIKPLTPGDLPVRRLIFDSTALDVEERGKIQPPKFKDFAQIECFRQLTFWERIKILFGMNLMVYVGIVTQHRPGYCDVQIATFTTKHADPDAHLRDNLKDFMAKSHPEAFPK